jgi:hypothetical protein
MMKATENSEGSTIPSAKRSRWLIAAAYAPSPNQAPWPKETRPV